MGSKNLMLGCFGKFNYCDIILYIILPQFNWGSTHHFVKNLISFCFILS